MKQFYVTLVAVCYGLSAIAAPLQVKNAQLRELSPMKKEAKAEIPGFYKMTKVLEMTKKIDAPTRADESTSIEGTWTFALGDYYFQTSTNGTIYVDFEATLEGSYVWFEDPTDYELPFVGLYNSATNTITFSQQYLGTAGNYYVYQDPFVYNWNTNKRDSQSIVAQYNASAGTITFEADNGIAWPACTSQNISSSAGYFGIYDLEGATMEVGDDDENWQDVGNAIFMDGWVLPGFGIDQTAEENQWEVPLQQNIENENLYRLVDPYHCGPFAPGGELAQANSSASAGYIVFDVTDPDHVLFKKSIAGFANSGAGISQFYCYNTLAWAADYLEEDPSTVIAVFDDDEFPYTTFKDGVVSLSYIVDEGELWYDANFGIQGNPLGGYSWTDENDNPSNMTAAIIFPIDEEEEGEGETSGVNSIYTGEVKNIEYFDIMGRRVNNPTKGQVIIKKQGETVSKILVK